MVYAPESGKIIKISIENGQEVTQGTPLIQIESESLKLQISQLQQDQEILKKELLVSINNPEAESYISGRKAQIAQNEEKLLALFRQEDQLTILADNNGKAVNWNMHLTPGQYVYEGQIFGSIADTSKIEVIAFVKETSIEDVKIGQKAQIVFQDSNLNYMHAEIIKIDRKRVKELIYPSLGSIYKGPLAVDLRKPGSLGGGLLLHDSYYLATLSLDDPQANLFIGKNVEVKIRGPWKSYFVEVMKYIYLAVFKESSF
jgi:putative peptide zinc metalloprotease protein